MDSQAAANPIPINKTPERNGTRYIETTDNYAHDGSHSIAIGGFAGALTDGEVTIWAPHLPKYSFYRCGRVKIGYDPRVPNPQCIVFYNHEMVNWVNKEIRTHLYKTFPKLYPNYDYWWDRLRQTGTDESNPVTDDVVKLVEFAKERITASKKTAIDHPPINPFDTLDGR